MFVFEKPEIVLEQLQMENKNSTVIAENINKNHTFPSKKKTEKTIFRVRSLIVYIFKGFFSQGTTSWVSFTHSGDNDFRSSPNGFEIFDAVSLSVLVQLEKKI